MKLSSTAFPSNGPIPVKYTGDGQDVSPELSWDDAPDGTTEFALICDDPDAPASEPWVHWLIFKIPADWRQLPEGVGQSSTMKLPGGPLQGRNSWPTGNMIGYRGPQPPRGHGTHHYHFRLCALDHPVDLAAGITKAELMKAINGHVLKETELVGTYRR